MEASFLRPLWALLVLLLHGRSDADLIVQGLVGRDVTLTCRYDVAYYGALAVCWGKGPIPNSGCGDELIRSDGAVVTSRASERYVLSGDLRAGDVSLTVRQLSEADAGTYGCRVDIPGWFNDHKHHTKLMVAPGPPDPVRLQLRERRSRSLTLSWTPGFHGGSPLTGYTLEHKNITDSWSSASRISIGPQLTRASLSNLQPFTTYSLRLVSLNTVGPSPPSNTLTITTSEEAPGGPPLDVQLGAQSSSSLEVSWRPPRKDLHHGMIQRYMVGYRVYEEPISSQPWSSQTVFYTGRRQKLLLENLQSATQYQVMVQAVNGEGPGPTSPQLVCSTLEDELTTAQSSFVSDATSAPEEEHELTTAAVTDSPDPDILWEQTSPALTPATDTHLTPATDTHLMPDQEEVTSLPTGSGQSTTFSNENQEISSEDEEEKEAESHGGRLVGIIIPVVLILLIVAMASLWQLRRMKLAKKGNLEMLVVEHSTIHH